jgi:hypothetical protein
LNFSNGWICDDPLWDGETKKRTFVVWPALAGTCPSAFVSWCAQIGRSHMFQRQPLPRTRDIYIPDLHIDTIRAKTCDFR